MPITARMRTPYPAENQDPFYEQFVGMVDAVDASLYAGREDRQVVLMDGGTFSFVIDPLTGIATLTWTGTINLAAPITGFKWFLGTGSVDLLEGEVLFVNLARAPLTSVALTAQKGSQVPSTDSDLIIGIRRGTRFYFRNGRSLEDGDTLNILEVTIGTGGGGGSTDFKTPCRLATTGPVTLAGGAPDTIGVTPLAQNDRILVWQQSLGAQNGIYTVQTLGTGANGTWVRSSDANSSALVKAGLVVVVTEGAQADKLFELLTNNPISLGVTSLAFAASASIGTTGQSLRSNLPIALGQNTALGTFLVIGAYAFAKNQYTVTGTTTTTQFKALAHNTGGCSGEVLLYDLTAAAVVPGSLLTFTSALPIEQTASVTLNAASHVYEVRIRVSAGVGSVFCQWAGIEVLNTF